MHDSERMTLLNPADASARGLRVVSLFMGIFCLFMGFDKVGWLADSGILVTQLREWLEAAAYARRWYLETIAIPGAPVFARLGLVGENAVGLALLAGFRTQLAALAGIFMVLNFHFAMGVLLQFSYLWNGYGPPVLGSLLALVVGGAHLPFSVSRRSDGARAGRQSVASVEASRASGA